MPGLTGERGVLKVSKDLNLKGYIYSGNFDNTPEVILTIEDYLNILKDLYIKDKIGLVQFFALLSAYIDEWEEKVISNEADKIKELLKD